MEWDPPNEDGSEGYLKWYLDGKFIYGIHGSNLKLTGTEIPSEPMYLLMNTAVASSWGFPKPCPEGCKCTCYQCGNPECMCGLPDGFCENLPASFEIDYVRAYQAKGEPKHILGCSTEVRPTSRFIQGHKEDYMNTIDGQKEPLLAIQRGGGYCETNEDCGYPTKGECSGNKRCACQDNFTGPKCLSHAGFDDTSPPVEDIGFDRMRMSPAFLVMVFSALMVFVLFVGIIVFKRRKQVEEYEQLPSADNVTRLDADNVARVMQMQQQQQSGVQQGELSYQQSGGGPPPYDPMGAAATDKTVTYCMIDGRLLDE